MSTQKKISFLLPNDGVGGGVRAIKEFANGLLSLGHDVRVIYKKISQSNSVRGLYRSLFPICEINWLDDFQGQTLSYGQDLNNISFDEHEIVISMCSQTTLDAFAINQDVSLLYHCHGVEYENWERFERVINLPIPIIAVSSHVKRLIEKYSFHTNISVVPNGICHDEYYFDKDIVNHGVGGCLRYSYPKNPLATIEVFRALKAKCPNTKLYSFGVGKKHKILSKTNYLNNPSIEEARETYNKCKVWFLTSIVEGFGLPVLEAMACGCVVVSTMSGGPEDIIVDGHNGFLVEIGNYGALVSRIQKVLDDNALYSQMSKNALKSTISVSWAKSSKLLEDEVLRLANDNFF